MMWTNNVNVNGDDAVITSIVKCVHVPYLLYLHIETYMHAHAFCPPVVTIMTCEFETIDCQSDIDISI